MRRLSVAAVVTVLLALGAWHGAADASLPGWAYGAGGKLTRGLMNVLTGWLELPNAIVETSNRHNVLVGATWGTLQGASKGLLREAVAVYETVTFPIAVPANYAPILGPVYAFGSTPPP